MRKDLSLDAALDFSVKKTKAWINHACMLADSMGKIWDCHLSKADCQCSCSSW